MKEFLFLEARQRRHCLESFFTADSEALDYLLSSNKVFLGQHIVLTGLSSRISCTGNYNRLVGDA